MPRDAYLEPYRRAVDQFGDTFEVALWATPTTQLSRFEVFQQMGDLSGKRVLDAGCGRGDFAAWLVEQGIEVASFVGVDGVPELIELLAKLPQNPPNPTSHLAIHYPLPILGNEPHVVSTVPPHMRKTSPILHDGSPWPRGLPQGRTVYHNSNNAGTAEPDEFSPAEPVA